MHTIDKLNRVFNAILLPALFVLVTASVSCTNPRPEKSPLENPNENFEQLQFHDALELDKPGPSGHFDLSISNPYGDIHLRRGEGSRVEMTLFVQRSGGSTVEGAIQRRNGSDSMGLQVVIKPGKATSEVLRIDLVALIPESPRLRLTTKYGMIEAKKISNPLIEASSETGEIRITTGSIMHAYSKQGRIRATIMRPGWSGESRLSTDSGSIYAFFPLSPNLDLAVSTAGLVRSEYGFPVETDQEKSLILVHEGDGSDMLNISSDSGDVQLYSVVFDPRDYAPMNTGSYQGSAENSIINAW